MTINKDERQAAAQELRNQGYNCATSVLATFDDITGLTRSQSVAVTSALGSGIGGSREICGAAAAMSMVVGTTFPAEASQKGKAAAAAKGLLDQFASQNHGCLRCGCLKDRQVQGDVPSCDKLVGQCVGLVADFLNSH